MQGAAPGLTPPPSNPPLCRPQESGFPKRSFVARAKGGCFSVRHSDDGNKLAAGYNDGNLFLFDTTTAKSVALGCAAAATLSAPPAIG